MVVFKVFIDVFISWLIIDLFEDWIGAVRRSIGLLIRLMFWLKGDSCDEVDGSIEGDVDWFVDCSVVNNGVIVFVILVLIRDISCLNVWEDRFICCVLSFVVKLDCYGVLFIRLLTVFKDFFFFGADVGRVLGFGWVELWVCVDFFGDMLKL